MQGLMFDIKDALKILELGGVPSEEKSFGFCLKHSDLEDDFAHCGIDNDTSISMSVNIKAHPPIAWFFRNSFIEMAEFIVNAYKNAGCSCSSRGEIVRCLRELDEGYDKTALNERVKKYLDELEGGENS